MPDLEWPAMLFKANGDMLEWDGEMFDYLIVEDADEAKAALDKGWSNGKPAKAKAKAEDKEPDLHALRAEYKKVVGKKAFNGWDADTLKAKIAQA